MSMVKVLFFAADPLSAPRGRTPRHPKLQLDEDVRLIREKVRAAKYRDALEFDFRLAARPNDLLQALNESRPQVVHFSGHGTADGLVLMGGDGLPRPVAPAALGELFRIFRGDIRLVVLNACLSLPQARAIADTVGCAIGTNAEISDEASITFGGAFYGALAFGCSVQIAFEQARLALAMNHPGFEKVLEIVSGPDVEPSRLVLVEGGAGGGAAEAGPLAPRSVPPSAAWTGAEIDRRSAAARVATNPKRLPRIERLFVSRDYRPAIEGTARGGDPGIFALVGEAGFGKTTLLGQLHDELVSAGGVWAALLLCTDVALGRASNADQVALELGRTLCGQPVPVDRVVAKLREDRGAGVLLIDTLDLLLNEESGRELRDVLHRVADAGGTVVFTCREWEYDEYLVPRQGPESGLSAAFRRKEVPWFDDDEVRRAAELFIQALPAHGQPSNAASFASALLDLSSDSRSLREIVHNPLRLSLLCELFHDAGAIPPDLTVTELYSRYWAEKVAGGRSGRQLAYWKADVCLRFAEIGWRSSSALLAESVREEALRTPDPQNHAALEELQSESILVRTAGTELRFFHQTFQEYVLARWLTATEAPERLLDFARHVAAPSEHPVAHWWPVLRQALVLCGPERARAVVDRLDLGEIGAFRAVAQAAVAGEYPEVLRELLLPRASEDLGFRKSLLLAVESPSRRFFPQAWTIVIDLLGSSRSLGEAMQAAKSLGTLLLQAGEALPRRLHEAVSAVNGLSPERLATARGQEPRSVVLGTLVATALPALARRTSLDALRVLRATFTVLGETSRTAVLNLYLDPSVPRTEQAGLLRTLLEAPTPPAITESVIPLFDLFAPWNRPAGASVLWSSWQDALYGELPSGWDLVRARSAGRAAVNDPAWLRLLLQDLLYGDRRHLHQNLLSLHAAVLADGGEQVSSALLGAEPTVIQPATLSGVSALVRHVAGDLSPEQRTRLAEWLVQLPPDHPEHLVPALTCLGEVPAAMERALRELDALPLEAAIRVVDKALYSSPPVAAELVRHLSLRDGFDAAAKDAAALLVSLDAVLAGAGYPFAVDRLADVAAGPVKELGLNASKAIGNLAARGQAIPVAAILRGLRSPVPGVRKNLVLAAAALQRHHGLSETELTSLARALTDESDRMVVQSLCELAATWILKHQQASLAIGEVVSRFPERLTAQQSFDGGTARAVAWVYRALAAVLPAEQLAPLANWARALLSIMTSSQMDNSQGNMFTLLAVLGRRSPGFFRSLLPLFPRLPLRVFRVIVTAVDEVEGRKSALLGEILELPDCPREMARLIHGLRGG